MPGTIVVPLDRSELSERALPFARSLARQHGASLMLLSILNFPAFYADWSEEYLSDGPWSAEFEALRDYLEGIARGIEDAPVEYRVRVGVDPAIEIDIEMNALEDAVLVMTTNGHSGVKRLVLGSVTSRITHIADYPLMVIPVEAEEWPESYDRALLPLDGSTFAEYALETTLETLAADPPEIHLLTVIDAILGDNVADQHIRGQLYDRATEYLRTSAEDLRARGHTAEWEIVEALDVANSIAATAHRQDADLIAMATHGRTGFSRFFLGSVADGVIRSCDVPVLLIRPSESVVENAPESRTVVSRRWYDQS